MSDSLSILSRLVNGNVLGLVYALNPAIIDPDNSTATPLGANASFVGKAIDVTLFTYARISVFTDQASAPNGLQIQWSTDGINWNINQNSTVQANAGLRLPFTHLTQFFRIMYVNGPQKQNQFTIQTFHQSLAPAVPTKFIGAVTQDSDDAVTVKSILTAKNSAGIYVPALLDSNDAIIGATSLGTTLGKSLALLSGLLTTTTMNADQVVLAYTVTAGKTLFLQNLRIHAHQTSIPGNGNPVLLGAASLESPAGTKLLTDDFFYSDAAQVLDEAYAESIPFPGGTVIRVVVTPASTTSTVWRANFVGYEK